MKKKSIEQKANCSNEENYRSDRFKFSIFLFSLTVFIILLFSVLYLSLINIDVDPKNDSLPGASLLVTFFTHVAIIFLGLIVFAVAAISSLIGFCLGSSSIKYLPTKRMTIGAKIISFSNLILFVISIIGLLYFLKLFF